MISKKKILNSKPGEEVVLHLRRHWFIFLKIVTFFAGLLLVPVVLFVFIQAAMPSLLIGEISYPFLLVMVLAYYLVMLVFILTAWTETYLDVWTITTHRIINREQLGLFNRVVSELDLAKIQDVTAEQKGFFATVLHYGDVYIQTAGAKERFAFEQIPQPYRIAKIIEQLDEKIKQNQNPTGVV